MAMTLEAIMKLDSAGFTNPLGAVMGSLRGLMGVLGVGGGIVGAIAGFKRGLDLAGTSVDMSAKTGVAIADLTVLRQAFEDTGVGAEQGTQAIVMLQRNLSGLAGQGGADAVKRLGLDMAVLGKMSATDQLATIGKAMQGISDPAQQTAIAMEIFGRSGAAMKQFFADPGAIDKVKASLGSLPAILQRSGPMLDEIGDAFGRLPTKISGFFVGIEAGMGPALKAVTDWLDSIDFAAVGERFGRFLSTIIEAFKEGKIGELIGASVTAGLLVAIQAIPGLIMTMLQFLWDAIKGMFGFIEDVVGGATDGATSKLSALWADLQAKVDAQRGQLEAVSKAPALGEGGKTLDVGRSSVSMDVAADKLARMGGFLGGGPALGFAQRTAHATHRTAEGVERVYQALTNNHLLGSVWA